MKYCPTCKTDKETDEFPKNRRNLGGLHSECKVCAKERITKWRKANKEYLKEYDKEWQTQNKDKKSKNYKKWQQSNKAVVNSVNSRRRAAEKSATPLWADTKEIQYFYNLASYFTWVSGGFVKYHVDHVVPLKGKQVCGLHVQNNLQILKSGDNLRKSNKHECNI
jgi:hypothetical protein